MWLFTIDGFYSAVQDKDRNDVIWIRARVKDDLSRLVTTYDVHATEILVDCGTDYKYRIGVWREEWVRIAGAVAHDINYNNFKYASETSLGKDRATVLADIWWTMYRLQLKEEGKLGLPGSL